MKLSIENSDNLDWALRHNDGVKELRLSAVLVRQVGLDKLLESIARFPDLAKVAVADDYIRDPAQIDGFENAMRKSFPEITFRWTYDLRVDGKHGR